MGFVGRFFPDGSEKEKASKELARVFGIYDDEINEEMAEWMHYFLEKYSPGLERMVASQKKQGASEIPDSEISHLIVDFFGTEIFEGDSGEEMRDKMLDRLIETGKFRKIFDLFLHSKYHSEENIKKYTLEFNQSPKDAAKDFLKKMKVRKSFPWRPGKRFAQKFVDTFRFPSIFAGIPGEPARERSVEAAPKSDMKELRPYQLNMKEQALDFLRSYGDESLPKRAILTLPTGSGKTRIAVESIVDILNEEGIEKNVLWIAQTDEVCEQAVQSFKQVWEYRGKGESLEIFRAWGDNEIPQRYENGIVVGGINKLAINSSELYDRIAADDKLRMIFIDETHHADANSYQEVLNSLGLAKYDNSNDDKKIFENDKKIPIIGLTATPERTDERETISLRSMFGNRFIVPKILERKGVPDGESGKIEDLFDDSWNSIEKLGKKLTEKEYLAEEIAEIIRPDKQIILNEKETEDLEKNGDEGEIWRSRIASEENPNTRIQNRLLELAKDGRKILYFGTNKPQSIMMSNILKSKGIGAAHITGETKQGTRKAMIEEFNKENSSLQVLCNYNVLSTGFDSPKIDTVFIARPTKSRVAYRQMVGRGMRGRRLGGNEDNKCLVVTVQYNILNYKKQTIDYEDKKKEKIADINVPSIGSELTNDELSEIFSCQNRGGIRFAKKHNYVILVDSDDSNYVDYVNKEDGTITYTGTGEDNQKFDEGIGWFNSRVKDSSSKLLYFKKKETNKYKLMHHAKYMSHVFEREKNKTGIERDVIKFKLKITKSV